MLRAAAIGKLVELFVPRRCNKTGVTFVQVFMANSAPLAPASILAFMAPLLGVAIQVTTVQHPEVGFSQISYSEMFPAGQCEGTFCVKAS
jgi:hypothetical protein